MLITNTQLLFTFLLSFTFAYEIRLGEHDLTFRREIASSAATLKASYDASSP
ncbi:MAG: hypothetical protein M1608_07530 [Candidatus Omnitrophica bacterium]|nr:hypothetical protein [Candidatus Omnitrophota bacterium]